MAEGVDCLVIAREALGGEVGRGAGRPQRGGANLPGGDVAGGDQAAGTVAEVLVFAPLGAAGADGRGGGGAFARLDAGQRIGALSS